MARDNNHHDVNADSGEKDFPLAKSSLRNCNNNNNNHHHHHYHNVKADSEEKDLPLAKSSLRNLFNYLATWI